MGADPEAKRISDAATVPGVKHDSGGFHTQPPSSHFAAATFEAGTLLAGRYEILQVLGRGGMGAVYKAHDRELQRDVALKVIRPELAQAGGMLERFKQEVILARQVTHRNAVRIYDLGEAEGVKFLTMEFVEGTDLATLLRERGAMSPPETAGFGIQICRALEAAHAEGVIHRDLKPQNIMVDANGRVVVMDFGLARSAQSSGMTQTGAMVGTLEYMAPEQALGKEVGPPTDIFATGLILYELLTGKMPFEADSAIASLFRRTHGERAAPVSEVNRAIPLPLSDVVAKCLEADMRRRYQSAGDLARDLEQWQAGTARRKLRLPRINRTAIVAAAAVIIALAAAFVGLRTTPRAQSPAAVTQGPAISLVVVPFRNASGDPSLDWVGTSLAEMLSTDVGQSEQLRIVPSTRVNQVLRDLRITSAGEVDAATLRRIAEFVNADTVVAGQYVRAGDQIRVDAVVHDIKGDRTTPLRAQAANEQQLFQMADTIATSIRGNLSLTDSAQKQLDASAFKPTTNSVPALRAYNEGLQAQRRGSHLEARRKFEAAVAADRAFALAHASLASSLASLGYDDEAQAAAENARDAATQLSGIEKQLVTAAHAAASGDLSRAIASYEKVAESWPDDVGVLFSLASAYEDDGQLEKAGATYARIVALDPKHVTALLASGRVEIKAGRTREGLDFLNRAFPLAQQFQDEEAKAAILQAQGVAYKLLNRPQDALKNYEESLAIKRRIGQQRGIAVSLNEIAQIQGQLGEVNKSLATFEEALRIRRSIGDKSGQGDTLMDMAALYSEKNQASKALDLLKQALQVQRETGNELMEAACLNNIGVIYLARGEFGEANTYFERAYAIREKANVPGEMADSLHNLAETDAATGNTDEALRHYVKALEIRRGLGDERGAAIESLGIGNLLFSQARYSGALQSQQETLKTLKAAQERSTWTVQALSGAAATLVETGRASEANPLLEEAIALASELKAPALAAQALSVQGDAAYYSGDNRNAAILYGKAMREAATSGDAAMALNVRLRLQRLNMRENGGASTQALQALRAEAQRLSLRPVALEAELLEAELARRSGRGALARTAAQRVRVGAERSGYRMLAARAHVVAAASGADDPAAARSWDEARKLLAAINADAGSAAFASRRDIAELTREIEAALTSAKR